MKVEDVNLRPAPDSPEYVTAQSQPGTLLPRLAWIMVYAETGSVQKVCDRFGITKKTFYKWFKRYQEANGNAQSLVDHSRRPHHSPKATPEMSIRLLLEAKKETGYGQRRLKAYLEQKHRITLSERTIWKLLKTHSLTDLSEH